MRQSIGPFIGRQVFGEEHGRLEHLTYMHMRVLHCCPCRLTPVPQNSGKWWMNCKRTITVSHLGPPQLYKSIQPLARWPSGSSPISISSPPLTGCCKTLTSQ